MVSNKQIVRDIYDACDEEFGGQHRAEAIRHANAMIEGYEADKPKTEIDAYKIMRQAYREVAAKEAARNEPASRKPGAAERSKPFKPGTPEQVRADMKAGTYKPFAS
ncbi:MAG TPA: hypothetical protein VLI39_14200 [Sedimentisphaerales bacterium]|nr:hypothetical protein [Sedimentisphaerales bacterium]